MRGSTSLARIEEASRSGSKDNAWSSGNKNQLGYNPKSANTNTIHTKHERTNDRTNKYHPGRKRRTNYRPQPTPHHSLPHSRPALHALLRTTPKPSIIQHTVLTTAPAARIKWRFLSY